MIPEQQQKAKAAGQTIGLFHLYMGNTYRLAIYFMAILFKTFSWFMEQLLDPGSCRHYSFTMGADLIVNWNCGTIWNGFK